MKSYAQLKPQRAELKKREREKHLNPGIENHY